MLLAKFIKINQVAMATTYTAVCSARCSANWPALFNEKK